MPTGDKALCCLLRMSGSQQRVLPQSICCCARPLPHFPHVLSIPNLNKNVQNMVTKLLNLSEVSTRWSAATPMQLTAVIETQRQAAGTTLYSASKTTAVHCPQPSTWVEQDTTAHMCMQAKPGSKPGRHVNPRHSSRHLLDPKLQAPLHVPQRAAHTHLASRRSGTC